MMIFLPHHSNLISTYEFNKILARVQIWQLVRLLRTSNNKDAEMLFAESIFTTHERDMMIDFSQFSISRVKNDIFPFGPVTKLELASLQTKGQWSNNFS